MAKERNWVTLTVADNQPLAEMTEQRLKEAGIPVVLISGDASAYMGASSPYELKVPEDRVDEAKELLND